MKLLWKKFLHGKEIAGKYKTVLENIYMKGGCILMQPPEYSSGQKNCRSRASVSCTESLNGI